MDKQPVDRNNTTEFDFGNELSRREVIFRGLAATGIVTAGLGVRERFDVGAENDDSIGHEPTISLPDAEAVHGILENEGFEGLVQYFRIPLVEYPSESDFGAALADRVRMWMMADGIVEQEDSSGQETPTDEQPEDTIGLAAVTALGGEAAVERVDGDPSRIPLYQKITAIRQEFREAYLSEMGDLDTAPEITTTVVHNEMTGQDAGRRTFQRAVALQYTVRGKGVFMTVDGTLHVVIDTSSGAYEMELDDTDPTPPFTLTHG